MCLDFGFLVTRHIQTRSSSGRRPRPRWWKAPQSALMPQGGAELGHEFRRRWMDVQSSVPFERFRGGESCVPWLWGPEDAENLVILVHGFLSCPAVVRRRRVPAGVTASWAPHWNSEPFYVSENRYKHQSEGIIGTLQQLLGQLTRPINCACSAMAGTLQLSHRRNYVHLDLKPHNLMLFKGRVKLIDVVGCVAAGTTLSIGESSISFSACYCATEWPRFVARKQISTLPRVWTSRVSA